MKKFLIVALSILSSSVQSGQSPDHHSPLKIQVDAQKSKKKNMLVVALSMNDAQSQEVCGALKRALEYTDQFSLDLEYQTARSTKKEVLGMRERGYNFVLFLNHDHKDRMYEWRLYDTHKAVMQAGFRIPQEGSVVRWWGYTIADSINTALTNNKPFACSKIAYCQAGKKQGETTVYLADFDGSHPELLVHSKRQIIAPRWNRDIEYPALFYSKYTPINIQLVSCTPDKTETVSSSFDGLNMLPTFAFDGKEVVLCLSRDGSSQLYHYGYNAQLKKVGYTRLTYNTGNNICPTFLPNGNLVFCSDFELGRPQLYYFDRKNDAIERLTEGAACSSPQYSEVRNTVAYSKLEKGTMQIFMYDLAKKQERQLTFNAGHKQECTWSSCGNYLAYSVTDGKQKQRIASHSLLTGNQKYLTPADANCSYPAWSLLYNTFPVVG